MKKEENVICIFFIYFRSLLWFGFNLTLLEKFSKFCVMTLNIGSLAQRIVSEKVS